MIIIGLTNEQAKQIMAVLGEQTPSSLLKSVKQYNEKYSDRTTTADENCDHIDVVYDILHDRFSGKTESNVLDATDYVPFNFLS